MSQEPQNSSQDSAEAQSEERTFESITHAFILNITAIRVFNERIGPVADEHDQNVLQQFQARMGELLPEPESAEGTVEIAQSNNGNDLDDANENGATKLEEPQEELTRVTVDLETLQSIAQALESVAKGSPTQGHLLRQGALTSLLSTFEVLISELIQHYYSLYPGKLPAKQMLTLETLRELDSTRVEDIETYLASSEADNLLYKSLKDQLAYFEGLEVKVEPLKPEFKNLTEITQRRNLLVHNKGIANRQYLSRVDDELVAEYDVEQGKRLVVTERYLNAAIDTVCASGLALTQLCWRKWDKASTEAADRFVVDPILYDCLREERFALASRIAQRLKGARYASEPSKRRAVVNHAIALKELGLPNEMESVLSCMDWSSSSLEYTLALHALRDEDEDFYDLLPRAVRAEAVERWHLEKWPVYSRQRGTERFAQAVEEHFPNEPIEASEELE